MAHHHGDLALIQLGYGVLLDQPGCKGRVGCLPGVLDGCLDIPVVFIPLAGAAV